MAETSTATPPVEEKIPGKIVSAGIPQRLEVVIPKAVDTPAAPVDNSAGGENNNATPPADTTPTNTNANTPPVVVDPTDEQLKAYFDKIGVPFEGVDKLKEKLTAPPKTEATPEEKEKAEKDKETRVVNEHLSRGGKVEQFAAYKNIIAADKKELGLQKEIEDLVLAGFSAEDATELANERYFQLTDEQIAAIEDPTLKEKATKQKALGLKKLENKGAYIQNTAKSYLDILSKSLAEQDAEKQKMEQHSSKVEDAIKKYQRKETLVLGQIVEGQDIPPIDFEYSETALQSAKEILIDAVKFEKQFFTNDGGVNLDFILPYIVKANSLNEAVKKSYLTAQDRTIAEFQAKFSSTPPNLGGNGKQTGTPGKLTSFGEKQVFKPTATK